MNPRWYQEAIVYEVHVRAFADSNGDGMGDFKGLSEKLDYLQDLGVTAIWVLPFYPSPWKDDGYDISDYAGVHEAYGSLRDFRAFLREAHRRGLRVITELVLNHTSDAHPWFRRARRAPPGSEWRDFYVWSDTADRYKEARIIFKDFEASNWSWDAEAGAYYWHRFYSHQPDLNFENPAVRRAMLGVVDDWLAMGVDGLRLDAVPYLYERDGTSCENLAETHGFLKELRAHIDARWTDKMLLAEANQWPEDAVSYFGDGDECHMAFHFPLMPRMFMAVRQEDRFPLVDILAQTPSIPEPCTWALFLRNHDELTLEMVTDEERDYMYRVYAHDPQMRINLGIRRRLAPLLGNNRRQIELMNGLLFSLPGTPVIYYGDEIGMGDNIYLGDRNGVRTPMQWSSDRNAGFSRANPQRLYMPVIIDPEYHAEAINVEAQQGNPHSLLWWMKRLIALRKRYRAFGSGTLEFLYPENRKVLAFVRSFGDERILVVANLSRYVQPAELNLAAFKDATPIELFGQTEFPRIGDLPYFLTLAPHAFYWFALEPERAPAEVRAQETPVLRIGRARDGDVLANALRAVGSHLSAYLAGRRWFAGKARKLKSVSVVDHVRMPTEQPSAIALVQVEYIEGDPQTYVVPVAVAAGELAGRVQVERPNSVLARLVVDDSDEEIVPYEALGNRTMDAALLGSIVKRRRLRGGRLELTATPSRNLRAALDGAEPAELPVTVMRGEQSNTSLAFGDRLVLKIFRRVDEGENPDLEIGRFLTERTTFTRTPQVAGSIELRRNGGAPMTIGILQRYVPNEGDAWSFTLDALRSYVDAVLADRPEDPPPVPAEPNLLALAESEPTEEARAAIGMYLESARLLGIRTAELHKALASDRDDPAFAPEPFTPFAQRALYQAMRKLGREVSVSLRNQRLPDGLDAQRFEEAILQRFGTLLETPVGGMRLRTHGDFHLGQVLYTGKDFFIIDFEGEPERPLSARRIKRSPLADVAGMVRSFHYAAYSSLYGRPDVIAEGRAPALEPSIAYWYRWVAATFLRSYLHVAQEASFLPSDPHELQVLFEAFLLEKAVYEVGYELANRPDWVRIPLTGIAELLRLEEAET